MATDPEGDAKARGLRWRTDDRLGERSLTDESIGQLPDDLVEELGLIVLLLGELSEGEERRFAQPGGW